MVSITIDGKECIVREGTSIIETARANGISIPTLGYNPRVSPPRNIETAFVEVSDGRRIRFTSAISTPVREGMNIRTTSEALTSYRRIYLQALLRDHYGDCVAPCVLRCPAHIDVQKYLYHAACGNFAEALEIIKESNPLPAVCGRVCFHYCEKECRRNALEAAVNINEVKRFVAAWDRQQLSPYQPKCLPESGFKVAVIGAGPAGLTAAWFLRRKGHAVTIFEMQEAAGGMLRWGIPSYRLPEKELNEDIQAILDLGVEIRYNKKLGQDFTLDSLKRNGFDAIFVGLGAQSATPIGVKGDSLPGVLSGLDFLARLARNERPDLGKRVLVIGGDNTAMDAARSTIRLGVKDVTIVYRRTSQEMPAQSIEVEEALEEGIQIQFLTAPAPAGITAEGNLLRLACTKMTLGEPDRSGRRRPVPIPGSEFTLTAHTIISAIGQAVDGSCIDNEALVEKWGNIKADPETGQTPLPWVFAGGDCVTGPDIAISAIGAGGRAAAAIDQYLRMGRVEAPAEPYTCTKGSWQDLPLATFKDVAPIERRPVPARPPAERKQDFIATNTLWNPETAMAEASRCLNCGCSERYGCDLRNYASRYGVIHNTDTPAQHLPIDDKHPIITRDPGKCILCGLCLKISREMEGVSALGFYETNNILSIGPIDNRPLDLTACVSCGHCAAICPTGALNLKPTLPKVYRALNDQERIVVAQIAPAVRAAFAAHYGLDAAVVLPILCAALKEAGFDHVFDTCWAADLTIMEEGTEFLSRLAKAGSVLPQITSCCPSWVNYCEKTAPDILPHLSSCKSPQQMFGAVMKQYFARQLQVPPGKLFFVSIMSCNAKKYEAARPEFATEGTPDVDTVLTTNDLIALFSDKHIDPRTIKPIPVDAFFGKISGAGIIFGATGGVAEAAIRLAAEKVMGRRLESFSYEGVRGLQGVKETLVDLGEMKVRLAVVSGIQNAQRVIDRIHAGDAPFDLIEVMACPGGCINGSGNPAPKLEGVMGQHLEVLYRLDQEAPIRTSQDNPTVRALYENWLGAPDSKISHQALHTHYRRRSMRLEAAGAEALLKAQPVIDVGVCIGTSCYLKGSWRLLEGLSTELRRRELSDRFRVRARFCTGQCGDGPNVVVGTAIVNRVDPTAAAAFIDAYLAQLIEAPTKAKES